MPSSLGGRLLLGAAIFTAVALVVSALAIGLILHHFITGQIDQRLDAEIATIANAVKAQGPDSGGIGSQGDSPPFDRPGSGWYWQVRGEGVDLRSRSLGTALIELPPMPLDWRRLVEGIPASADGVAAGEALHLRVAHAAIGQKTMTIIAAAPSGAITGAVRQALIPLVASLIVIGLGLVSASVLQVRLGLRPLAKLRTAIADVRAARISHVPVDQPQELQPLAAELNGLIDQNAEGLASARRHVSNLAHGLKTPLANLSIALNENGSDPTGTMKALVEQIDSSIRHHLGRARTAAVGAAQRRRIEVAPRLEDIAAALAKIHAERNISFGASIDPALAIACEAQDLDEMLGNLLDNAFKWARSCVQVDAQRRDNKVEICVHDDGAGLAPHLLPEILLPGRRLDETVSGYGFGLSITRELSELYGGSLALERGPRGGLLARLVLPVAMSG